MEADSLSPIRILEKCMPDDGFAQHFGLVHDHGHEGSHDHPYHRYHLYPHLHQREKTFPIVIKTLVALLVAWAVATLLAFFGIFLPTNGIPAVVGVVMGFIALLCLLGILFVRSWPYRCLVAAGVGIGFYILMVVVFWA